jgi:DNA-binding NarL/FixJ family response regulator
MQPFVARIDELLATPADDGPLSPRELEVAALVADGNTNKEIAAALFLSERTAQNHVQHILTKLGLANRTQVAAWFRERRGAAIGPRPAR